MRNCVEKLPIVYIPVYWFTAKTSQSSNLDKTKPHAHQQTIEIISENFKMIVQDCMSVVKLPTVQIFGMAEVKG